MKIEVPATRSGLENERHRTLKLQPTHFVVNTCTRNPFIFVLNIFYTMRCEHQLELVCVFHLSRRRCFAETGASNDQYFYHRPAYEDLSKCPWKHVDRSATAIAAYPCEIGVKWVKSSCKPCHTGQHDSRDIWIDPRIVLALSPLISIARGKFKFPLLLIGCGPEHS